VIASAGTACTRERITHRSLPSVIRPKFRLTGMVSVRRKLRQMCAEPTGAGGRPRASSSADLRRRKECQRTINQLSRRPVPRPKEGRWLVWGLKLADLPQPGSVRSVTHGKTNTDGSWLAALPRSPTIFCTRGNRLWRLASFHAGSGTGRLVFRRQTPPPRFAPCLMGRIMGASRGGFAVSNPPPRCRSIGRGLAS
jgi:hypothetical protein